MTKCHSSETRRRRAQCRGDLLAITVGAEEDLEEGDGGVLQRGLDGESLGLGGLALDRSAGAYHSPKFKADLH